ncbi:hypothetical protein SAMN04487818_12440 [Actinokineospora terrae]|uniref:Uncharacterized protein n=1 Tax=Actinokineospora terrae TaxID=155974 RepID=A0A1H9XTY3_9PSEU|nr:hypothetical protein SAMN04487818_12440 [Actinokineospora terrae]
MSTWTYLGTDPVPGSVVLDDLEIVLEYLRRVKQRQRYYTELRESLELVIKDRLGETEVGTLRGVPVATFKKSLRISVSIARLRALHPDVAKACEDIAEVRTFVLLG